jgi:hypothetical protein
MATPRMGLQLKSRLLLVYLLRLHGFLRMAATILILTLPKIRGQAEGALQATLVLRWATTRLLAVPR